LRYPKTHGKDIKALSQKEDEKEAPFKGANYVN